MLKKIYNHHIAPRLQLAAASAAGRKEGLTAFPVIGSNMEPTLARGEIALYAPIADSKPLQRGDVVAFTIQEFQGIVVPSRVIGLSGDTLLMQDGELLVNDVRIPEPYVQNGRAEQDYSRTIERVVVSDGCVWLLGDFRDMSKDSRSFGPLPLASLLGKVLRAHAPGAHSTSRHVR